jgi:protein gp37
MSKTSIQWATHTSNYQAGCTKVSAACRYCYAIPQSIRIENMGGAERYAGTTNGDLTAPRWTGAVNIDRPAMARIFQGLRQARKPRRVFLNSMSDTFHAAVEEEVLAELAVELRTVPPKHSILLLTKRPFRMLVWQRRHFPAGLPANVWAGVTAENQAAIDERLPLLLQLEAGVRFASMEPLLGPVDIQGYLYPDTERPRRPGGLTLPPGYRDDVGLSWVIVGGESHRSPKKARGTELSWVEGVVDQCRAAGAAVFVKQLGTRWASSASTIDRSTVYASGDSKGADPLNWPASIRFRQLPAHHNGGGIHVWSL